MSKKLKGLKKLNKAIGTPIKERFGISKVSMTKDFEYSFVKDRVGWSLVENAYAQEDFISFVNDRFNYEIGRYNFIASILHEVGHAKNNDDIVDSVQDFCIDEKEKIAKEISKATDREEIKKINYKYFSLPDEIMATAWAIKYMKKHPRIIAKMWDEMWSAILDFYEKNHLEED